MKGNVRNMKVSIDSGKKVEDTQMLKGEAKTIKPASNETTQYTTKNPGFGSLGGRNTNS
jgi:hypothetical protein